MQAISAESSATTELAQEKRKRSPWLVKYQWTTETAKACQTKAQAVIAHKKALRIKAAQETTDPEAIREEQIRVIRDKLRRKGISAQDYAMWLKNLKALLSMAPDDEPAKVRSPKSGPIDPI